MLTELKTISYIIKTSILYSNSNHWFNKPKSEEGNTLYYNTEAPVIKGIEAPSHKVYHVFYDSPDQKSNHATLDTWQQAQAFLMDQSNPEMTK